MPKYAIFARHAPTPEGRRFQVDEFGDRQEYRFWDGSLYGRIAADDGGILFVRAGYGLDFDRVAVETCVIGSRVRKPMGCVQDPATP